MSTKILKVLMGVLAAGAFCCAQEEIEIQEDAVQAAPVESYAVSSRQNGVVVNVGKREIRNLYKMPQAKGKVRPADMFRVYMHGLGDADAMPVAWEMLGDGIAFEDGSFKNALKSSDMSAVMLEGGSSLVFPKPLFSAEQLQQMHGKFIRFFVWIKAENTGNGADLWSGAPSMEIEIVDFDGEVLSVTPSYFRTRGTYPWFCYYMDVEVPIMSKTVVAAVPEEKKEATEASEDEIDLDEIFYTAAVEEKETTSRAGGLYIKLANPVSGKAWFSTLSWKTIRESELISSPYQLLAHVDPVTNSTAPNPDYDELPMHFMLGVAPQGQLNFLRGNKANPGIVKIDELKQCLDKAGKDWMYMVYALPKLALLYNSELLQKIDPSFNAEWFAALHDGLAQMQSAKSGMWTVDGQPSLFATHAIAFNAFAPEELTHPGYTADKTPWLSFNGAKIAFADAMIRSIVAEQRTYGNSKVKAGWNNYAFMNDTEEIDDADMPCDLSATTQAVRLLAMAASISENEASKQAAYKSIKDAWNFVMKGLFMQSSSLWKLSFADKIATVPGSMFDFIEATAWLDIKQNADMNFMPPTAVLEEDGSFSMQWKPEKGIVSLRVFAAPAELQTSDLNESHLVAIVQPKNNRIQNMDPYNAMKKILVEAKKYWGIEPAKTGNKYIATKMASIPAGLKTYLKPDKVKFKIKPAVKPLAVHIAAVNAYGEMKFITLPVTIAADENAANNEENANGEESQE